MKTKEDLEIFTPFAKKSKDFERIDGNNCIIYTRVSTKEQEDGFSLITQKRVIENACESNKFNILSYFGGVFESAKTDEREEFNRMLKFARSSKQKVSYIMVYSVDRFSRSGANAIYIASELRKENIKIFAVTQPADTYTATGRMQQNMQFIFSEYDNDLRREKCTAGMREMLLKGQWCSKAPLGYDQVTNKKTKEQTISVNETGKLIKKAFYWKADQNLSNTEILSKLKDLGLNLRKQKLSELFANPFYCGILSHNLLNGEVLEGKHEKLIPKEIFLKVNNLKGKNGKGKHSKDFTEVPLKGFVKCGDCGTSFIGYLVKKKNLWYYRCNKNGCKCNRNTQIMHKSFLKRLDQLAIPEREIEPVKDEFIRFFNDTEKENIEVAEKLKIALIEVNRKIEAIEERFTLGEIERDLYQKFIGKYKGEKTEILKKLDNYETENLNLQKSVNLYGQLLAKLPYLWGKTDYKGKVDLQNILFPSGLLFDRENNDYRTNEINDVVFEMKRIERDSAGNDKGDFDNFYQKSPLVPPTGIEPVRP